MKIIYYTVIVKLYKIMGGMVHLAFTNSTWTDNHIK